MRAWFRHSFRNRIFITVLIATLIPLFFCGTVMMQLLVVRSENKIESEVKTQLTDLEESLDAAFSSYEDISNTLCSNTIVRSVLRESTPDSRILYQFLFQVTDKQRENARFDIFDRTGRCLYTTGSSLPTGTLNPDWGVLYDAGQSENLVFSSLEESASLTAAQAIRSFDSTILGYVVISMEEEHFEHLFSEIYSTTNDIILLDTFWRPVYLSQPAQGESTAASLRVQLLSGKPLTKANSKYFFFAEQQERTGFTLILQHPKVFTPQVMRTFYTVSTTMVIACLLFCLLCAWILSHHLAQPVHRIDAAMKEVENGNYEIHLEEDREDELGHLAKRFNQMTAEYQANLKRSVERQKELNKTRLRMMQAQLNPHFLYNTLDSIKWLSLPHEMPEVGTMATDLAALLRASISGKEFITLEQELDLLEQYLDIQYIRFEDRFTCEIDINEQFQSCIVPKLVLQPLVENAILHGIADMDDGYIKVSAAEQDHCLILSVSDNGRGIPEEMLQILNSDTKQIPGNHLGLYNVDSIIRLHYGEEYGLSARSDLQNGSCVTVTLPMQKEYNNA